MNKYSIAGIVCLVMVMQFGIALKYENPRILLALLSLPLLFLVLLRSSPTAKRKSTPPSRLTLLPLAMLGFLTALIWQSWRITPTSYDATATVLFFWLALGFFSAGVLLFARNQVKTVSAALVGAMTFSSLIGFLQYFGFVYCDSMEFPPAALGWVGSRIDFAVLLMISVPLCLHWALSQLLEQRRLRFVAGFTVFIVQFSALVIANSRLSLLLCIAASAAVILRALVLHKIHRLRNFRLALYVLLISVAVSLTLGFGDSVIARYSNVALELSGTGNAESYRGTLYQAQWQLFVAHPFFGTGIGSFPTLQMPFVIKGNFESIIPHKFAENGHCDPLNFLCEFGLVGIVPYLFIVLGALIAAFRAFRRERTDAAFLLLLTAGILTLHGLTNAATRHIPTGFVYWGVLGMAWGSTMYASFKAIPPSMRKIGLATAGAVHVFAAVLFAQLLFGDFYYFRSETARVNRQPQQEIAAVEKALRHCPFHREALYKEGFIAAQFGKYEVAEYCMKKLDTLAPGRMAVDVVRAFCFLQQGRYDSAVLHARKELADWPSNTLAEIILGKALLGMKDSAAVSVLRRKFELRYPPETLVSRAYDPNAGLDPLRSRFHGPFIEKALQERAVAHEKPFERYPEGIRDLMVAGEE